jgi:FkbM family methyltransferase
MSNQAVTLVRCPAPDPASDYGLPAPATARRQGPGDCTGQRRSRPAAISAYLEARERFATYAVMWGARWTPYMEPEILGLSEVVGRGSVCVDVGAAAGLYTLVLSRLVGPSGRVHSVEPLTFAHPGCARLLRARAAGNVRRHRVALGSAPGRALMSVPVGQHGLVTGRSFLAQAPSELGANAEFDGHVDVPVEVKTLDSLCEQNGLGRLDFVKIDVEGAELQVLEGGEEAIAKWRPAILLEIEARHIARYGGAAAEIVTWLARRGYAMYVWQDGWRRAAAISPEQRNYLFQSADEARGEAGPATQPCAA